MRQKASRSQLGIPQCHSQLQLNVEGYNTKLLDSSELYNSNSLRAFVAVWVKPGLPRLSINRGASSHPRPPSPVNKLYTLKTLKRINGFGLVNCPLVYFQDVS
jgi:hypothetical protein